MSYDLAVWFPDRILTDVQALHQYQRLGEGDIHDLALHPAIKALYVELSTLHPEVGEVPADKSEDFDFCPWSVEHDRSDSPIIMSSVWPHAQYAREPVLSLAAKHGLAVFDPQELKIHYPVRKTK